MTQETDDTKAVQMQNLAQRLLRTNRNDKPDVQLLAGKLPSDMPVDLSYPAGATIVGSVVRDQSRIEIVLGVAGSVSETVEFYRTSFQKKGWSEFNPNFGPLAGFSHRSEAFEKVVFCQSKRGPSVTVTIYSDNVEELDVRLEIQPEGPDSPCAIEEKMRMGMHSAMMSPIPTLRTPPDVEMVGSAGSGSNNQSWYTTVNLRTALGSAALAQAYDQQLIEAGWTLLKQGDNEASSWSIWSAEDKEGKEWAGRLVIIPSGADEELFFAYLNAEQVESAEGSGRPSIGHTFQPL